jgi:hypothetical protein
MAYVERELNSQVDQKILKKIQNGAFQTKSDEMKLNKISQNHQIR